MVRDSLKACVFRGREASSPGAKPMALFFGEGKSRCFRARSRVFGEFLWELLVNGPVSFSVFACCSSVREVNLFGGGL